MSRETAPLPGRSTGTTPTSAGTHIPRRGRGAPSRAASRRMATPRTTTARSARIPEKSVSAFALNRLFGVLKDNIRVVVLNACYTRAQADAIADVIDCVIGMNAAIDDEAARVF